MTTTWIGQFAFAFEKISLHFVLDPVQPWEFENGLLTKFEVMWRKWEPDDKVSIRSLNIHTVLNHFIQGIFDAHIPCRATWSNRKIITTTGNGIFRQRSGSRGLRPFLSSLISWQHDSPWKEIDISLFEHYSQGCFRVFIQDLKWKHDKRYSIDNKLSQVKILPSTCFSSSSFKATVIKTTTLVKNVSSRPNNFAYERDPNIILSVPGSQIVGNVNRKNCARETLGSWDRSNASRLRSLRGNIFPN